LGYLILPVDLIPDILFPAGYADDVAALSAAIAAVRAYITPEIERKAKTKLRDWFGSIDESELKY